MSKKRLDPYRRPRLTKSGLLTLMGPSGYGVFCIADACSNPGCSCRDIVLDVAPIDFRVSEVKYARGDINILTVTIGGLGPTDFWQRRVNARLNPDTGELLLLPRDGGGEAGSAYPQGETLLEPVRAALDAELLDEFALFCRREKGDATNLDDPVPVDRIPRWPRTRLGYAEVFDTLRVDTYREDGSPWQANDIYCADPRCSCTEVNILFHDPHGEGIVAGDVGVELKTGDVTFRNDTPDENLVPRLWRRYVERHRGVDELVRRRAKMREFGKKYLGPVISSASAPAMPSNSSATPTVAASLPEPSAEYGNRKVGRNDPCPCGSGKKYKKCCLPMTS